jgi:hypothetical protein
MAVQIQLRNGSAADWSSANPTLALGEIGVENDTIKFKIGTGSVAWNSLGYAAVGTVSSVAASVPSFLSVSGSPITTTGTLAISYSGTALPIANGGTGQTTASAAFNALSPITTAGDLILGNGSNSATRLAIGANNYVLTSNGTTAVWAASGGGLTTGKSIAMAMIFGF